MVWAMGGATYTDYSGTTDAQGQVIILLPPGEYRFRCGVGGQQYWSGTANYCDVPGCTDAVIAIP